MYKVETVYTNALLSTKSFGCSFICGRSVKPVPPKYEECCLFIVMTAPFPLSPSPSQSVRCPSLSLYSCLCLSFSPLVFLPVFWFRIIQLFSTQL